MEAVGAILDMLEVKGLFDAFMRFTEPPLPLVGMYWYILSADFAIVSKDSFNIGARI